MKIDQNYEVLKVYWQRVGQVKGVEKTTAAGELQGDSVEISPLAREMQLYQAALRDLPDIREEAVSALKKQLQDGSYQPSGAEIGQGIIKEVKLDKLV
ncbi:MAG: flagellar biosynthesis anti-sigma factor FlgM [Peptococcaceae bacterium]|nr:MAG: flagellar biosynthesis anti-sigma factor FlgM [Peptococcaceae bacterium]